MRMAVCPDVETDYNQLEEQCPGEGLTSQGVVAGVLALEVICV